VVFLKKYNSIWVDRNPIEVMDTLTTYASIVWGWLHLHLVMGDATFHRILSPIYNPLSLDIQRIYI
jgi:hypothetical protein